MEEDATASTGRTTTNGEAVSTRRFKEEDATTSTGRTTTRIKPPTSGGSRSVGVSTDVESHMDLPSSEEGPAAEEVEKTLVAARAKVAVRLARFAHSWLQAVKAEEASRRSTAQASGSRRKGRG